MNNLKINDKIKLHIFDTSGREIKTNNFDKVFTVYEENNKLGIYWTREFTPFDSFSHTVKFEVVSDICHRQKLIVDGKDEGFIKSYYQKPDTKSWIFDLESTPGKNSGVTYILRFDEIKKMSLDKNFNMEVLTTS